MTFIPLHAKTAAIACALITAGGIVAALPRASFPLRGRVVSQTQAAPLNLRIRYPADGARLPYLTKSFVFGQAPPGAFVSVNGAPATVAPSGGWIAFVPFSPGRFALHVTASVRGVVSSADTSVTVAPSPHSLPPTPARVDADVAPAPQADLVVEPGDDVRLNVKASASSRVSATLPGIAAAVALLETTATSLSPNDQARVLGGARAGGDTIAGIYEGEVRVPASAANTTAKVTYTIVATDGSTAAATSKGVVSVQPVSARRVGVIVLADRTRDLDARPYGIVESSPDGGWLFFPPAGTPFGVTGSDGDYYRVALGSNQQGWINKRSLVLQSAGRPMPSADVQDVGIRDEPRATTVRIHLTARVPYRIDESPNGPSLRVRLYDATAGTDYIAYGHDKAPIRSVRWDQLPGGIAALDIDLRQRTLWGYHADWDGDDLRLTIKKPPHMARAPTPAVRGLLVVVDPGHSPDTGAIGPLGTQERDVNLAIAKRLAVHLQSLGARTVLTRYANVPVGLYERTGLASKLNADVLISVHNNALPDGSDPFNHHGFSVYYYQPHSLELARFIHASYARRTHLVDYGLYYDNLALARPTEEPAVLTESAFIMWPPEEMLLRDAAFQDRLGSTIAAGIESWAEAMRAKER
ncbi:MAG: N-acetylmuramoyl-L-alanine amidase [Candidatus Eremiobacteraeota bacterium]|nr:N-acetylmuramoyl-L-alanine amidase [Candidatus Eremiobacteraeota bacterium]MBC5808569.1 N-acetylmuramoyl-L-alanine amidase [Candidatus Eremiobacteraeota bacterium]